MTLEIDVVCLFPAMVEGPLSESIPGRTRERGLADVRVHDLRQLGPRAASERRRRAVRRRGRAWSCGPSRSPPRSTRSGARTRPSSCSTRAARSSARRAPPSWPRVRT